jgi:hypothetical protein
MRPKGRPKGSGRENGFKLSKMTNAEVEEFITTSTDKIFTEHLSYNQYISWCREQRISERQASEYWKRVWQNVKDRYQLKRDELIDKHLKSYWDIHGKALKMGDLSNARQTLNDIAKLQGLNEPDKINLEGNTTIEFKFGDE